MRYFRNINEFVLIASVSCGVAFLTRLFPQMFWAVLLVRLGILGFAYYMLHLEGQKELALIVGGAIALGWLLGYGDWLLLYTNYDSSLIIVWGLTSLALIVCTALIWGASQQKNETR